MQRQTSKAMLDLIEAAKTIQEFENASLTHTIASCEADFKNKDRKCCQAGLVNARITPLLLEAAFMLKKTAGQINVLIHSVGILLSLPYILQGEEIIESLSLGAGNTGRNFDLETSLQIAEFKFINWRGGSESIRQNSLFKDFYNLAEHETLKKRYLYVLGTEYPLRFFNGNRDLKSVLSKDQKLNKEFFNKYSQFARVNEYYNFKKESVKLIDISQQVPEFNILRNPEAQ